MLSAGSSSSPYHRLDAGPPASHLNAPLPSSNSNNSINRPGSSQSNAPLPIAPAPPPQVLQQAPLVPYPQHAPPPVHMNPAGAPQGQIICNGCRTLLVYPNNATNVRCALCSIITPVPPAGTEMARLVCGGCRTLLMYIRGATSVQCSMCHTVNLAMEPNQVAHINCGGCGMTLMYAYGAQSVKCSICQVVTNVAVGTARMPLPMHQSYGPPQQMPAPMMVPTAPPRTQTQTVVVENPMTMDDNGKMVSNVAVGVTTEKKM
eukprot:jgi/Mesen1/6012/ME000306S05284